MAHQLLLPRIEGDQKQVKGDLYFRDKTRITREILAYLHDHPNAQDTIEGIMQWWLLERKLKDQESLVREALNELEKKKFVIREKHDGVGDQYRVNTKKKPGIEAILQ